MRSMHSKQWACLLGERLADSLSGEARREMAIIQRSCQGKRTMKTALMKHGQRPTLYFLYFVLSVLRIVMLGDRDNHSVQQRKTPL